MRSSRANLLVGLSAFLLLFTACDSSLNSTQQSIEGNETVKQQETAAHTPLQANVNKALAEVRSATSKYQDVRKAEADGYEQASPFVPGMGYHYVNGALLDNEIISTQPEALVYNDNPVHGDKRKLVAVEYIIPDPEKIMSHSDLADKLPGVDGDKWHFDPHVGPGSWTLHAWVWYPNPEGIFHPTNPRLNQ